MKMKTVFHVVSFAVMFAGASVALAQNKVIFDNKSGEPALVRLIGPTATEIEVPSGTQRGVDVSKGQYGIKVRYGSAGHFRYTKGEQFDVAETATSHSETTITLHKVLAGNYETHAISKDEFLAAKQHTSPTVVVQGAAVGTPTTPVQIKWVGEPQKYGFVFDDGIADIAWSYSGAQSIDAAMVFTVRSPSATNSMNMMLTITNGASIVGSQMATFSLANAMSQAGISGTAQVSVAVFAVTTQENDSMTLKSLISNTITTQVHKAASALDMFPKGFGVKK